MGDCYLVTGASGFVGGHLVRLLAAQGLPVRAMVRDAAKAEALKPLGIEVVIADLQNPESLEQAMKGVRGIYHIASIFRQAGLPESVFHDVNAEGTRRLLEAAIAAGVERVIHCSTVGVLGHVETPPANELTPYNPGDMYQRSKMEGEKIALDYFRSGRISGVVIRPAMIYGPGDDRTLKIFKMIARRQFFYIGNGEAFVHWIDVRDLAKAFILAMEKSHLNGETYIIAGEKAVPLSRMVETVARYLQVPPPGLHLPVKPMQALGSLCEAIFTPLRLQPPIFRRRVDFFTKSRYFDASKAARDLGFRPTQPFEEELSDITQWYQNNGYL
jgi:nucleoside-diphosphate-sugar epimerase